MGVQDRKQREKANREQAILAAAKAVFGTKGLVATTIDDIAAEAEMGTGTLYRYYRSREAIMLTISEQAFEQLHDCFVAAAAQGTTGLDKLQRAVRAYYQFALDNPAYFRFVVFSESPFTTATSEKLQRISTAIYGLMSQLHAQGVADGSIRQDINAHLIANILWACSSGMMQFITNSGQLVQQQQLNQQDLFEAYLKLLGNALSPPSQGENDSQQVVGT